MLNTVYRLTAPRTIEPVVVSQDTTGKVIVRPTYLSICNADQRYYQGTRSKEVLDKKLPMALIHEGIGRVVSDNTGAFQPGDIVVMLPNAPTEQDEFIAENYLRSSRFCGSGFDGFMQESMVLPPERVVLLPQDVNCEVAAFTELVSVATHAISRFDKIAHGRRERIGVWGDGNMGYIVSLLLHTRYPDTKIVVFGRNESKLHDFTFADETHLVDDVSGVELVDHAFECAGGEGSVAAIEQIIDRINPEGTVSLLGVSENNVPICRSAMPTSVTIRGRAARRCWTRSCPWRSSTKVSAVWSAITRVRSSPAISSSCSPTPPPNRMNLSLRTTFDPAGSAAAVSMGSCRRAWFFRRSAWCCFLRT